MDILASLLGAEAVLFELADNPGEVLRLCREITDLWLSFYGELGEIIRGQRVFSDWSAFLSEKPTYILQCDFSYMIGPQMVKDFVYDDLVKTAAVLDKPFYHLDGIGELAHLDSLLSIDGIKGIQWIPGTGDPEMRDWNEVYARISASGKKIMAPSWPFRFERFLDEILAVTQKPDEVMKMPIYCSQDEKKEALKRLAGYGAL
jgi:5-methyltetrahydrofolate--homocysteine methyltransferase